MNAKPIPAIYIYQISLIALILFVAILLWSQLGFLLAPFLWACAFYALFLPRFKKLESKTNWGRSKIAWALILLMLVVLIVFLLIGYFFILPNKEVVMNAFNILKESLTQVVKKINIRYGIDLQSSGLLLKVGEKLGNMAVPLIQNSANMISDLFFTLFLLYFMLINHQKITTYAKRAIPLNNQMTESVITQFSNLVRGNLFTIPLVAIAQGIVAVLGYWIIGIKEPVLLGMLTGLCSVIPIVGTAFVYVPLALYYFLVKDDVVVALEILALGLFIIGLVDNVARFFFQKQFANIGVFDSIIGVIVGVGLFGMSGLIFGPILLLFFKLLIRVYIHEFDLYKAPENANNQQNFLE